MLPNDIIRRSDAPVSSLPGLLAHLAAAKEIARFERTERSAELLVLIDAALDEAYLQFRVCGMDDPVPMRTPERIVARRNEKCVMVRQRGNTMFGNRGHHHRDPTAAQVRGDIQSGKTGDIHQGFDPAAAPLETDGEAAGTPMSPEHTRLAIETQRWPVRNDQTDFDTAMRAPGSMKTVPQGKVSAGFLVRLIGSCFAGATLVILTALWLS